MDKCRRILHPIYTNAHPPKLILNDALLKQLAAQFLMSRYYPLFMSEERREGGKERGRRMEGEREREIEIDR